VYAHPLTTNEAPTLLYDREATLEPQAETPNAWYWRNATTMAELLHTVRVNVDPNQVNLKAEEVYKLVSKWEFWDTRRENDKRRMPISGFDDAVTFNVVSGTQNV
jgi:hypothetical protein